MMVDGCARSRGEQARGSGAVTIRGSGSAIGAAACRSFAAAALVITPSRWLGCSWSTTVASSPRPDHAAFCTVIGTPPLTQVVLPWYIRLVPRPKTHNDREIFGRVAAARLCTREGAASEGRQRGAASPQTEHDLRPRAARLAAPTPSCCSSRHSHSPQRKPRKP